MLKNAYAITFMPLSGLVLNVHCRSTLNLFKYYQSANRIKLALIAFNGFRDFLLKHNLTWNEESFVVGNFSLTIFLVFSLTIRNYNFVWSCKSMELLNVRFACEVFTKDDNIADTKWVENKTCHVAFNPNKVGIFEGSFF